MDAIDAARVGTAVVALAAPWPLCMGRGLGHWPAFVALAGVWAAVMAGLGLAAGLDHATIVCGVAAHATSSALAASLCLLASRTGASPLDSATLATALVAVYLAVVPEAAVGFAATFFGLEGWAERAIRACLPSHGYIAREWRGILGGEPPHTVARPVTFFGLHAYEIAMAAILSYVPGRRPPVRIGWAVVPIVVVSALLLAISIDRNDAYWPAHWTWGREMEIPSLAVGAACLGLSSWLFLDRSLRAPFTALLFGAVVAGLPLFLGLLFLA